MTSVSAKNQLVILKIFYPPPTSTWGHQTFKRLIERIILSLEMATEEQEFSNPLAPDQGSKQETQDDTITKLVQ